ncbi:MAG: hypothetical protein AAF628_36175 [Planctomycetota bacterium]
MDQRPGGPGPAPWSFRVPLDTPFAYNGADALILNWQGHLGDGGMRPADQETTASTTWGTGTAYGSGCVLSGSGTEVTCWTQWAISPIGQTSRLGIEAGPVGRAAATVALLGVGQAALAHPSLCGPLLTTSDALIPLGGRGPFGTAATGVTFTHDPALLGRSVFVQAATTDPGQSPKVRMALSSGFATDPYPAPPPAPPYAGSWISVQQIGTKPAGGWPFANDVRLNRGGAIPVGVE